MDEPKQGRHPGTLSLTRRSLIGRFAGVLATSLVSASSSSAAACAAVEVYPGYPGYRGFITGLNGAGDVACFEDLQARGFDREAEDARNSAAASELGITGKMKHWTWENWMAIEARRTLPPTCYVCNMPGAVPARPSSNGVVDPTDPRLRIGTWGTTVGVALATAHLSNSWMVTQFVPTDMHLRALVGMANPGSLNALQVRAKAKEMADFLTSGSFMNTPFLTETLRNQGGYAPTPPTATPNDQYFLMSMGISVVAEFMNPMFGSGFVAQFEAVVRDWRYKLVTDPQAPSLAERVRTSGLLG